MRLFERRSSNRSIFKTTSRTSKTCVASSKTSGASLTRVILEGIDLTEFLVKDGLGDSIMAAFAVDKRARWSRKNRTSSAHAMRLCRCNKRTVHYVTLLKMNRSVPHRLAAHLIVQISGVHFTGVEFLHRFHRSRSRSFGALLSLARERDGSLRF